jgi:hypothetical protein
MAVLHEEAGLRPGGMGPREFVEDVIGRLPGLNRDYRLIASLRRQLPLLMEAAPGPLLSTLEHLLEGDPAGSRILFQEGGLLGGDSVHTWVLWALETMAWDPDFLGRSSAVLAGLARLDPGGRLHNRPLHSLREIFLPWHPGTNASLDRRMAVLDQVAVAEPEIAWKLLVLLLPEHSDAAHPTSKPRYREAGASQRESLTWGLVFEGYRQVVNRVLELAQVSAERWKVIVKELYKFEPPLRERTIARLADVAKQISGAERRELWATLQKEINRHRTFAEAEWALRESELQKLDEIQQAIAPNDFALEVAWLFDDHVPNVPPREGRGRRDEVDVAREVAVRRLWEGGGAPAILRLAEAVSLPHFVALSIAAILTEMSQYVALISESVGFGDRLNVFARSLSGEAERRFGQEWRARMKDVIRDRRWTLERILTVVMGWQDSPATWRAVDELGADVASEYWKQKPRWPFRNLESADIVSGVRRYLAVGRATAALDAIYLDVDKVPSALIFEILDGLGPELARSEVKRETLPLQDLGDLLDRLGSRADVEAVEVARREYMLLPLLGYRERKLMLHRVLAEDANTFVSMLSDVFRPSKGDRTEPSKEQRAKAEIGYRVLSSFRVVPGLEGPDLNGNVLRTWIVTVRQLAAAADRTDIADQYVGHVLAHAPIDPTDQAWPHRIVRGLIEEFASEQIELGIVVERRNMRGVVTKAMFEGGRQESGLAAETRRWAQTADKWPRTAHMLNDLAQSWEASAEREQERARQDMMRFD